MKSSFGVDDMSAPTRSRLVLGTAALGLPYGLPRAGQTQPLLIAEDAAVALLRSAHAHGFGALDTAPAYGVAEVRIGLAGTPLPVWTKLAAGQPATVSLQASLHALRCDRLALVQWHNWTAPMATDADFRSTWRELGRDPRITALGASTYGVSDALAAVNSGFFSVVQVEYHLLNQGVVEAISAAARAQGVAIAVRSVLLQGVLTERTGALPPGLAGLEPSRQRACALANDWGLPLTTLALRAALDHPAITWVLMGADGSGQIAAACAACASDPLTPVQRQALAGLDMGPTLTDPRTWPATA